MRGGASRQTFEETRFGVSRQMHLPEHLLGIEFVVERQAKCGRRTCRAQSGNCSHAEHHFTTVERTHVFNLSSRLKSDINDSGKVTDGCCRLPQRELSAAAGPTVRPAPPL